MKNILALLSLVLTQSVFSKETATKQFHRLLIFNDKNEIMLVKIKNMDFWVTPGFYSSENTEIEAEFESMASSYGLNVTSPQLRGIFQLENQTSNQSSVRHFYTMKVTDYQPKQPEFIDTVEWLPLDLGMKKMTFPHINLMLKQVMKDSETVWKGTVIRYKDKDQFKAKVKQDFYPLEDE